MRLFNAARAQLPIRDHGEFAAFTATGPIGSGMTRLGREIGNMLNDEAIYTLVPLGNEHGFVKGFDDIHNPGNRLGGRLIASYFDTCTLKTIPVIDAIDYILSFEENKGKDSIFIQFDEHGQYVFDARTKMNLSKYESSRWFSDMLALLFCYARRSNMIVTPFLSGPVSEEDTRKRYFLTSLFH